MKKVLIMWLTLARLSVLQRQWLSQTRLHENSCSVQSCVNVNPAYERQRNVHPKIHARRALLVQAHSWRSRAQLASCLCVPPPPLSLFCAFLVAHGAAWFMENNDNLCAHCAGIRARKTVEMYVFWRCVCVLVRSFSSWASVCALFTCVVHANPRHGPIYREIRLVGIEGSVHSNASDVITVCIP